jgi:hypothetical protein
MSLIQTKEHGICVDSIAPKSQGIFDHGRYEEAGMDDSLLVPVLAANPGVGPLRTERVAASPTRGAENAKDKSENRVDDGRRNNRERRDESGRADALALAGNQWNAVDPSLYTGFATCENWDHKAAHISTVSEAVAFLVNGLRSGCCSLHPLTEFVQWRSIEVHGAQEKELRLLFSFLGCSTEGQRSPPKASGFKSIFKTLTGGRQVRVRSGLNVAAG